MIASVSCLGPMFFNGHSPQKLIIPVTSVLVLTSGVNDVQSVLLAIDLDAFAVRILDCWVIPVGTFGTKARVRTLRSLVAKPLKPRAKCITHRGI